MDKVIAKSLFINLVKISRERGIGLANLPMDLNSILSQETQMIPFDKYALLFEFLLEKTGDKSLGLHIGEQFNMTALGIVGQLIQASSTIEEGLNQTIQNFNLISNVLAFKLETDRQRCLLKIEVDAESNSRHPDSCYHLILSSMVFAYREIEYLTLKKPLPIEISLTLEAESPKEFKRVFRQPVRFNSKENAIAFDKKLLEEKIIFADYELFLVLEGLASSRLSESSQKTDSFTNTLRTMIFSLLDPAFPTLTDVASNLNMSERKVQRKLRAEGMSYSRLIQDIKKEVALNYLKKDLSIKEISYLMGYSEASAFVNAFKGWFRHSPANYRLNSL